jgi:hypothetical protein
MRFMYLIITPSVSKSVPLMRWAGVPVCDGKKSGRESRGFEHVWNCFHPSCGLYGIDCKPPTCFGGNIDVWLACFPKYLGNCNLQGLRLFSVEQFALLV